MILIEVFSDPGGQYLGTLLVDPDRLPLKRFCGLFYWRKIGAMDGIGKADLSNRRG